MSYQLNKSEGNALHHLAIALRPDWVRNRPGQVWRQQVTDGTFPHAVSFAHAVKALVAYSEPEAKMRTPNLFPQPGWHWDSTAPQEVRDNGPKCVDHDWEPATTCRACHADVKVGDRPKELIGKHLPLDTINSREQTTARKLPPRSHSEPSKNETPNKGNRHESVYYLRSQS